MNFHKLEAAGNDFILLDLALQSGKIPSTRRIQELCDRHFGIGADGIIVRLPSKKNRWKFFNNDGSEANFCGNAARAFTLYLQTLGQSPSPVTFESNIGLIRGRVIGKGPSVHVEVPLSEKTKFEVPTEISKFLEGRLIKAQLAYLNSGVPHLVIGLKKLPSLENRNLISRLIYDHKGAPKGKWNITWLETSSLSAVTWERGVEDETLACGSGALACYLALEIWSGKLAGKLNRAKTK